MDSQNEYSRLRFLLAVLLGGITAWGCYLAGVLEIAVEVAQAYIPAVATLQKWLAKNFPFLLSLLNLLLVWPAASSAFYKPAGWLINILAKFFGRHYPPFLAPLQDNRRDRLSYQNPDTPFVGRDGELSRLHEFAARPERFLYWTLTGPSGSGKSRLAAEWGRALVRRRTWLGRRVWDVGFFQGLAGESAWQGWQPHRATVVVVDEFSTCPGYIP